MNPKFKIRRCKMEKGKSNFGLIMIVIVVTIALVVGVTQYDSLQKKNGPIADYAANTIMNSMEYLGDLPWDIQVYNLRAVLICGGQKIFVKNNREFGASALNCGYYIAHGVYLEPVSNLLTGEGTIRFAKEKILNE